jgi:hypothetical protein
MIAKLVIKCVISSMCGVQRDPVNIDIRQNKPKDAEQISM